MDSGTRSGWACRAPARAVWLVLPLCLVLAAASSFAAPVTITLNYTRISGSGTASGSVTLDDSLLVPNFPGNVTCDLSLIDSFSLTVTGLATSPSSTSFTKADLIAYYISTDSRGNLTALNFFMLYNTCDPTKFNADRYAIDGIETFILGLYQLVVGDGTQEIAEFELQPPILHPAIPTLSKIGIAGLAILLLVAGALVLARRLS